MIGLRCFRPRAAPRATPVKKETAKLIIGEKLVARQVTDIIYRLKNLGNRLKKTPALPTS